MPDSYRTSYQDDGLVNRCIAPLLDGTKIVSMISHHHGQDNTKNLKHLSEIPDCSQPILLDLDYFP